MLSSGVGRVIKSARTGGLGFSLQGIWVPGEAPGEIWKV